MGQPKHYTEFDSKTLPKPTDESTFGRGSKSVLVASSFSLVGCQQQVHSSSPSFVGPTAAQQMGNSSFPGGLQSSCENRKSRGLLGQRLLALALAPRSAVLRSGRGLDTHWVLDQGAILLHSICPGQLAPCSVPGPLPNCRTESGGSSRLPMVSGRFQGTTLLHDTCTSQRWTLRCF